MNDALLGLLTLLAVARTIVLDDGAVWTFTGTGEARCVGPWRKEITPARGYVRGVRKVRVTHLGVMTTYITESDCGGGDRVVRYSAVRNVTSDGHRLADAAAALGGYAS